MAFQWIFCRQSAGLRFPCLSREGERPIRPDRPSSASPGPRLGRHPSTASGKAIRTGCRSERGIGMGLAAGSCQRQSGSDGQGDQSDRRCGSVKRCSIILLASSAVCGSSSRTQSPDGTSRSAIRASMKSSYRSVTGLLSGLFNVGSAFGKIAARPKHTTIAEMRTSQIVE